MCLHLLLVPQVKWSYIKNKIILLVSETWQTMLLYLLVRLKNFLCTWKLLGVVVRITLKPFLHSLVYLSPYAVGQLLTALGLLHNG